MSYTIGSFNLYHFNMQSDDERRKDLLKIAEIIREEKFDIVALQEIESELYVKQLTNRIGLLNWKCCYLHSEGSSHDHAEGYAFLWNTNRMNTIGYPKVYKDYGVDSKLVRPPQVARFTPVGLPGGIPFELRLINTHIAFKRPANYCEKDVEYRRKEFEVLINEVYPRVADHRYGNNMPAYTLLMGDYNLCIVGNNKIVPWDLNKNYGYVDCDIGEGRVIRTIQSDATSLKQPKKNQKRSTREDSLLEADSAEVFDENGGFYSNDYDHFTFDLTMYERIGISKAQRVEALGKYYDNELGLYRKEISDHVPIKLVLDINGVMYLPLEKINGREK